MPRLERSARNRVISGVCGGIAEYLQVNATVVRVVFVVLAILTGGLWAVAYLVLLILMPLPGRPSPIEGQPTGEGAAAAASESTSAEVPADAERARAFAAYALIVLGVIFLLGNAGFRFIDLRFTWPLILIALGVFLLVRRVLP